MELLKSVTLRDGAELKLLKGAITDPVDLFTKTEESYEGYVVEYKRKATLKVDAYDKRQEVREIATAARFFGLFCKCGMSSAEYEEIAKELNAIIACEDEFNVALTNQICNRQDQDSSYD